MRAVAYAVENARFQWEDGERRLRDAGGPDSERAIAAVTRELRRRLGSTFTIDELAELYGEGVEWATAIAPAPVVDAAFARYAREAADYAGGRRRTV